MLTAAERTHRNPTHSECKNMRLIDCIAALFIAAPAAAVADWQEYSYPDFSFTVHFPAEPKIEAATYPVADGRSLDARVYSVTKDTGVFRLIVADVPEAAGDETALIGHAVKALTDGAT